MSQSLRVSHSGPFGCHQHIKFKEERWWIVNVYEEMAAIIMMVMKREVKRLAQWDVSGSLGQWREMLQWMWALPLHQDGWNVLLSSPSRFIIIIFFRTMPCGTRFASFTLSEQLFLMLNYFSCGIENCWNKWLGNSNCIHSWHWYWQIASFPHWNRKFTRQRHKQVLGRVCVWGISILFLL